MTASAAQTASQGEGADLLNRMQWRADPLADRAVAAMVGSWESPDAAMPLEAAVAMHAVHFRRIALASRLMAQWTTNASLVDWCADLSALANAGALANAINVDQNDFAEVSAALEAYVRDAQTLPSWVNVAQVQRAETIFFEQGVLSCLLLFCASLPECYVAPDLADVLHAAGQLEAHTEHRIRATAAMIFPVMMRGGLTTPEGSGVAQVLKVRLIHAMIRNLILRGAPEDVIRAFGRGELGGSSATIPPLTNASTLNAPPKNLFEALFAHGWDLERDALPCNQEELAYTLLTFHYVYLRGMRTLGVPLAASDELAYLHAWNVMAHVLGVKRELMPQTVDDAKTMFERMQTRARADAGKRPGAYDPRPGLGRALMASLENVIPLKIARGFPSLLTKTLCGAQVTEELGIDNRASLLSKIVYSVGFMLVKTFDAIVRVFIPHFSISRLIGRVMGYHLMTKLLLDQTRPLKLPNHLVNQLHDMVDQWSDDRKAPQWLNWIEDRMTTSASWAHSARKNG
jgi:hypothetical protein